MMKRVVLQHNNITVNGNVWSSPENNRHSMRLTWGCETTQAGLKEKRRKKEQDRGGNGAWLKRWFNSVREPQEIAIQGWPSIGTHVGWEWTKLPCPQKEFQSGGKNGRPRGCVGAGGQRHKTKFGGGWLRTCVPVWATSWETLHAKYLNYSAQCLGSNTPCTGPALWAFRNNVIFDGCLTWARGQHFRITRQSWVAQSPKEPQLQGGLLEARLADAGGGADPAWPGRRRPGSPPPGQSGGRPRSASPLRGTQRRHVSRGKQRFAFLEPFLHFY